MLSFQWCDTCSTAEPGAVSSGVCNKKCGQKLVKQCIPLMRDYGDMQETVDELNENLSDMNQKTQQFQEYRKAKDNFVELESKEKDIMNKLHDFTGDATVDKKKNL